MFSHKKLKNASKVLLLSSFVQLNFVGYLA
jgi:hypothetical protein